MSESYPTTLERRKASSLARGLTIDAVKARRADAQEAVNEIVRGFSKLQEITGSTDYLDDTLAGLLDQLHNVAWGFQNELDNAGVDVLTQTPLIDRTEIHALLAKVRG